MLHMLSINHVLFEKRVRELEGARVGIWGEDFFHKSLNRVDETLIAGAYKQL